MRKLGGFRSYVTNKYYENRDEYDSAGQRQPHTFEQYVQNNLELLKKQYRQAFLRKEKK